MEPTREIFLQEMHDFSQQLKPLVQKYEEIFKSEDEEPTITNLIKSYHALTSILEDVKLDADEETFSRYQTLMRVAKEAREAYHKEFRQIANRLIHKLFSFMALNDGPPQDYFHDIWIYLGSQYQRTYDNLEPPKDSIEISANALNYY